MRSFIVALLLATPTKSCVPNPPVVPDASGGTSSISPKDKCIQDKLKDKNVQNVAHQSGNDINTLVQKICSDTLILRRYQ